ncbi:MAG: sodium:alanine symporter family protein [Clostridia bacterium]|nr:sodium:alanine symporter family protein [Clostridia bacterium]
MDVVLKIFQTINAYLSDYVLIFLLVATGLYFTIRTRFVQVRCLGEGMKQVFGGVLSKHKGHGLSSFQALATAVAAQVGTGNIVGASGAILVGGPGAIFWMWVIAFLGMATNYAEAVLAQKTRVVDGEHISGGPVYYIKYAFRGKFGKVLALIFAITATLALGFMGLMVQSNSIAESFSNAFGISARYTWIIGLVLVALCATIFFGGVKRLASVTEKLVPIMAILFLVCGFVILAFRIKYIPETFGMIFKYAFTPSALIGGGAGAAIKIAMSQGAKRGLFSNEAGMGSTPHAHAMATVKHPHEQGIAAMVGVFVDTFMVLTMTALVVISTLYCEGGLLHGLSGDAYQVAIEPGGIVSKTNAMQKAVSSVLGGTFGSVFVAVCLFFFAFSTIICWNFFGKLNAQYLFKNNKAMMIIYSLISIVFVFLGTILSNDLVWELTDFFNYLMVLPNVIALIALSRLVVDETKEARKRKKEKLKKDK